MRVVPMYVQTPTISGITRSWPHEARKLDADSSPSAGYPSRPLSLEPLEIFYILTFPEIWIWAQHVHRTPYRTI